MPSEGAAVPYLTEAEMQERNRANLVGVLRQAGGQVSGPTGAALLGIKSTTLASPIKKFQISKSEYGV